MLNRVVLNQCPHPRRLAVFFHGFMGDHRDFLLLAKSLHCEPQDSTVCVLYDLPGHGQSSELEFSSITALIDCLAKDLASFAAEKVIGIGYSLGGRVLAQLVHTHPALFTAAVFESSAFGIQNSGERQQRLQSDLKLFDSVIKGQQGFAAFIDSWYSMNIFMGLKDCLTYKDLLRRRLEQNPKALQNSLAFLSVGCMPYLGEVCREWQAKLFYCAGAWDEKYSAIGRALPKNFHYTSVRDASHNVHVMQPELFNRLVAKALKL